MEKKSKTPGWFVNDVNEFVDKMKHTKYIQYNEGFTRLDFIGLNDKNTQNSNINFYFYQDLWAARKVFGLSGGYPHYDIGSDVKGFIASVLSFRKDIVLIDIRPINRHLDDGLSYIQADATNLEQIQDASVYSLSALCSLEHFGLGRYGDPIDPDACFKAFDAIQRVMMPGGKVYISLPVGLQRIVFNAHRVYNPMTVIEYFNEMKLLEFSLVDECLEKPLIINADPFHCFDYVPGEFDDNNGMRFTGLFEFEKI